MLLRFLIPSPSPSCPPVSSGGTVWANNRIGVSTWVSALLAIALFSLTAPLTKEALAGYSVLSIGAGRGVIGGAIAILVVQFSGWRLPGGSALWWILLASPGLVFGFPFLITWVLTQASSADIGVVLAALPLLTAVLSSLINRRTLSFRFWGWALLGMLLTMGYFTIQSDWSQSQHSGTTQWLLLAALLSAAWGYAAGAKAAQQIGGWQTICWVQVFTSPVCAVLFGWSLGQNTPTDISSEITTSATLSLLYLGIASQVIGFRFWFKALAVDAARVSQIQLLQPVMTLAALTLFWNASVSIWQWLAASGILICVLGATNPKRF